MRKRRKKRRRFIVGLTASVILSAAVCGKAAGAYSQNTSAAAGPQEEQGRMTGEVIEKNTEITTGKSQKTISERVAEEKTDNGAEEREENSAGGGQENRAGRGQENSAGGGQENNAGGGQENSAGRGQENSAGESLENSTGKTSEAIREETTEEVTEEEPGRDQKQAYYSIRIHANNGSEDVVTIEDIPVGSESGTVLKADFPLRGYDGYVFSDQPAADESSKWFENGELLTEDLSEGAVQGDETAFADLYAQWYDAAAPEISYQESCFSDGSVSADPETVDFFDGKIRYKVTISDTGSGVDAGNLWYAVCDDETRLESFSRISAGNLIQTGPDACLFEAEVPASGKLYMKAGDLAYGKKEGSPELEKRPNMSEPQEIHAFVSENAKPVIALSEDTPDFAGHHTVLISVKDEGEFRSGVDWVRYELYQGKANSDSRPVKEELFKNNTPKTLSEIAGQCDFEKAVFFDDETLNGEYELHVTAADYCGNTADEAAMTIRFDNEKPEAMLALKGGSAVTENGRLQYYYRADNCGISVRLRDAYSGISDYSVTVEGRDVSGLMKKETAGENGEIPDQTGRELILSLTAEEVVSLGLTEEGPLTIHVEAEDAAGNPAVLTDCEGVVKNTENNAGFILDTLPPVITAVQTTGTAEDTLYKDTGNLYSRAAAMTIQIDVSDPYVSESCLKPSVISSGEPADLRIVKNGELIRYIYRMTGEGPYSQITLSGQDHAGNPLSIRCGEDGPEYSSAEEDRFADERKCLGAYTLKYGRVIDRTPPEAVISYRTDSAVTPYLYADYGAAAAYVSGNVSTEIRISDQNPLDTGRLYAGQGKAVCIDGDKGTKKTCILSYLADREGIYRYTVYGADRAGNPLTVTEQRPERSSTEFYRGKEKPAELYSNAGAKGGYTPKFELVIDRTAPTFTASLPKINSAAGETENGSTVFYGAKSRGKPVSFTISDENFDPHRVGERVLFESGEGHYTGVKIPWSEPEGGEYYISGKTYSARMDREGVYRFAIYGCDKAGNLLTRSGKETGRPGNVSAVSDKNGAFLTGRLVLDVTPPEAELKITDRGETCYHVSLGRETRLLSTEPYRNSNKALVSVQGKDRSPVHVSFAVDSSIAGQDRTLSGDDIYTNDRLLQCSVKGEQEFLVRNIKITDRSGNSVSLGRTNRIYLDTSKPSKSIDGPEAVITADPSVTKRSADGRDLFCGDVRLKLTAKDPNPGRRSGLMEVSYVLFADGRPVRSRTVFSDHGVGKTIGKDAGQTHEFSCHLTVPADDSFQTNDLEIRVTAKDKAGNRSEPGKEGIYRFGIDSVGPRITVSFDRNAATNGRYFNEPRTAVISMEERNLDGGRIRIGTQAKVPDSFAYRSGSGNGNRDIWKKTVEYPEDGDYTLDVSGTDALGNPAVVIYEGTAPRDFVIDRTAPIIRIRFDNRNVKNGKYYNGNRKAEIAVTEHNFSGNAEIKPVCGSMRGQKPEPPVLTAFSDRGDVHTAAMLFDEEGTYVISADCTDLAGNKAIRQTVPEFVIDKTPPAITPVGQWAERSVFSGTFEPRLLVDDTNYDGKGIHVSLKGRKKNGRRIEIYTPKGAFGGTVGFSEFQKKRSFDDIYELNLSAADLAGNEAVYSRSFSVNRFGSTFDYGDDTSAKLTENYYTNAPDDYRITEINVSRLRKQFVTVFTDGTAVRPSYGSGYSIAETEIDGGWQYIYTIHRSCMQDEGNYEILVQSEDEAGNVNTNSTVKGDQGSCEVPFVFGVDRTEPFCILTGADPQKHSYNGEKLEAGVRFEDNMKLSRIVLGSGTTLLGKDREDPSAALDLSGDEMEKVLSQNGNQVSIVLNESGRTRYIEAVCYDSAGNESEKLRYEVVVSTNPLVRMIHGRVWLHTAVFIIILGAAMVMFRVLRRNERRD